MLNAVTTFDTSKHHILIEFYITDKNGIRHALAGVIDTGAPQTELSDKFLDYAGFIDGPNENVKIKPDLQTQKYAKLFLPTVDICGYSIDDFEVFISRFDTSWGIDALIGLDFFRQFKVTIDYAKGIIITEPY